MVEYGTVRVSDLIRLKDIESWSSEKVVVIKAGTGQGKSYFIKNILYTYAKLKNKKILFLIHRSNCKDQFIEEIKRDSKEDIIHIETYQSIEAKILYNKELDFSEYEYIVQDEFHYYMSDSAWSKTTDISLDYILDLTDKVRIFMSATGDYVCGYLKNKKGLEIVKYELPISYNFIENLTFFNKDETIEFLLKECVDNNKKAIFFIQSATKAYELYLQYKDYCLFNCSRANKDYYKKVNQEEINDMLVNEKFNKLVLITTTCMDAGTNIIDDDLKTIVCDVEDTGSLIQCIGRKRRQSNEDKIDLYIKTISNNRLGGKETQLNKKIEKAEFLKEHTVKEYIEKYPRNTNDYTNIVYDEAIDEYSCNKRINELMYYKVKCDLLEISLIKNIGGYNKYISNLFGIKNFNVTEVEIMKNELEEYLESIVGVEMLQVKDRKELIEKIDVKSNGKILKKINNLNGALEERGINYRIVEFSTSKMINGKQKKYPNAWKIRKLTD